MCRKSWRLRKGSSAGFRAERMSPRRSGWRRSWGREKRLSRSCRTQPSDIFPLHCLTNDGKGIIIAIIKKTERLYGRCSVGSAGWSSLEARRAHNPKVAGSNPAPATRDGSTTHVALPFLHSVRINRTCEVCKQNPYSL